MSLSIGMTPIMQTIQIDAQPHDGQKEVHRHPARFKVLAAGRRWGKTRLGVNECLDVASKGGRAWWIAPSYKMSEVGWRPLRRMGGKIGANVRKVDRLVELSGGGSVQVRSADEPASLRGEGLDYVVLDEIAYMKEPAWVEAIRPALSDRQGKALFISTPKGRNWFWRLFQRGQEKAEDWQSWSFPTSSNPYIPAEEIDAARQSLPERIFRQEYEAEFIDDAGGVFRRVMAAATAEAQEGAVSGHEYIFGVDWARYNDATVFAVLDATLMQCVYVDRMTNTNYGLQRTRLQALYERFRPGEIVAEINSMGGPQAEALQDIGLPVTEFTTTNASKKEIIDSLAHAFETGALTIIPDPVLIGELQAFEQERTAGGTIRYTAPEGMHDDTVIALALAFSGVGQWMVI